MTTPTPTHNRLGPSKGHRWTLCPGSVREEAKYPDDSNEAGDDGTHTHTLLERCLVTEVPARTYVGMPFNDHAGEFVVDVARAERVQVALDYIEERRTLYGYCTIGGELRVDPAPIVGVSGLGGTCDVSIVAPLARTLEVIDYKDGMNPVSASDNPQLELYALGKMAGFFGAYPFDRVRMTIIQPKLAMKGLPPISGVEVPVQALLDRAPFYAAAARATEAPDAPLVPGESQCRYCRAKGGCSALAAQTLGSIGTMFGPVAMSPLIPDAAPVTPMDMATNVANKEPTTLSNEKIREVIEAAPLLRKFVEAVEEEALRRLKSGTSIPGLKLVYGRGSRQWALPEEEMAKKLTAMGIPKSSVYETKLISPAKAEKVTWTKRDGTQKQLTERQLKLMDKEYVSKLSGKLTVVSASDDRPAVELNAAPLFKAVEASAAPALPAWLQ